MKSLDIVQSCTQKEKPEYFCKCDVQSISSPSTKMTNWEQSHSYNNQHGSKCYDVYFICIIPLFKQGLNLVPITEKSISI